MWALLLYLLSCISFLKDVEVWGILATFSFLEFQEPRELCVCTLVE